jgi:hypothetical protein
VLAFSGLEGVLALIGLMVGERDVIETEMVPVVLCLVTVSTALTLLVPRRGAPSRLCGPAAVVSKVESPSLVIPRWRTDDGAQTEQPDPSLASTGTTPYARWQR